MPHAPPGWRRLRHSTSVRSVCLPRRESAAPKRPLTVFESGRRGSNPRPRRWQRRALPAELRPRKGARIQATLVRAPGDSYPPGMKIGLFGGDTAGRTIDDVVADARSAEADGFALYALPQIFALD